MYKVETVWDKEWNIIIPECEMGRYFLSEDDEDYVDFNIVVANTTLGVEMSFKAIVGGDCFHNLFFRSMVDLSDLYSVGKIDSYFDPEYGMHELLLDLDVYDEVKSRLNREVNKVIPLLKQFKEDYEK